MLIFTHYRTSISMETSAYSDKTNHSIPHIVFKFDF